MPPLEPPVALPVDRSSSPLAPDVAGPVPNWMLPDEPVAVDPGYEPAAAVLIRTSPLRDAPFGSSVRRRCCACSAANRSIASFTLSTSWNSGMLRFASGTSIVGRTVTYSGITSATCCAITPRTSSSGIPRTRRHSSVYRYVFTSTRISRWKMLSSSTDWMSRLMRRSDGDNTCTRSAGTCDNSMSLRTRITTPPADFAELCRNNNSPDAGSDIVRFAPDFRLTSWPKPDSSNTPSDSLTDTRDDSPAAVITTSFSLDTRTEPPVPDDELDAPLATNTSPPWMAPAPPDTDTDPPAPLEEEPPITTMSPPDV